MESLEISRIYKTKAEVIYDVWLDSKRHSEIIGAEAIISCKEGDKFNMWDGYITGSNIKLVKNRKIQQTWRTTDFGEEDEDSLLIIDLKDVEGGCEFNIIHTHIPKGQTQYRQGWIDNYLDPMTNYFGSYL